LFTFKPAPIQVAWLGYPNTTGLKSIDYRFTDNIADPLGDSEQFHTESLFRLPNGFHCYNGNLTVKPSPKAPQRNNNHITFGSFNNMSKVTPEVLEIWVEILKKVPRSHLLIKAQQVVDRKSWITNFFEERGILRERLEFLGHVKSQDSHLKLYDYVDIGLDTFPFNGATTTCEALWMGVPVIVLRGDSHVSRVGASILTNIGLETLIADNPQNYIKTAVKMAKNKSYIDELRINLREIMLKSPLCNGQSFARDVEGAYRKMWSDLLA
jgi:predicted O-linked N-acetylglucosamine transferase (SPINDLY family)